MHILQNQILRSHCCRRNRIERHPSCTRPAIRIGFVTPNSVIDAAICATPSCECGRALRACRISPLGPARPLRTSALVHRPAVARRVPSAAAGNAYIPQARRRGARQAERPRPTVAVAGIGSERLAARAPAHQGAHGVRTYGVRTCAPKIPVDRAGKRVMRRGKIVASSMRYGATQRTPKPQGAHLRTWCAPGILFCRWIFPGPSPPAYADHREEPKVREGAQAESDTKSGLPFGRVPGRGVTGGGAPRLPAWAGQVSWRLPGG